MLYHSMISSADQHMPPEFVRRNFFPQGQPKEEKLVQYWKMRKETFKKEELNAQQKNHHSHNDNNNDNHNQ
jgi:hypothetical protein